MFDIGFTELMLLALIGLLVLGPERLPRVARTLGSYSRKAREAWHNLKIQVESELDDLDRDGEMRRQIKSARESVQRVGEQAEQAREMMNQPVTGARDMLKGDDADRAEESESTPKKGDRKADDDG